MENEKIEIIYKMIINGIILNNKNLTYYGFSKEDIETLLSKRILEQNDNNTYKLVFVDKLRKYGVKLLLTGDGRNAGICFKICYQLAPNCRSIALQYLMSSVVRKHYNEAFKVLLSLKEKNKDTYIKDNNLYLYLLRIITNYQDIELDNEIKLDEEDIMLPEANCNKVENDIRRAIINNKFTYAYQLINSTIKRDEGYSVKYELIRTLLSKAITEEKNHKINLLNLAKSGQYNEIIKILTEKQTKTNLNRIEEYTLLLTDIINGIQKTNKIPTKIIDYTYDLYEAIIGYNFPLALEINEDFLEYRRVKKEEDIIHILLLKINELILNIERESTKVEELTEEETNLINELYEIVNYIRSLNVDIETGIKKIGILNEQSQLIKLICAKDYYLEGNNLLGDKLLNSVEKSNYKTGLAIKLLNKIKANKEKYNKQEEKTINKKVLTIN